MIDPPPEYDRSWHQFSDSDILVRLGAVRKLQEGIYQQVDAIGAFVYVLLEELPCSDEHIHESVQYWTVAGK